MSQFAANRIGQSANPVGSAEENITADPNAAGNQTNVNRSALKSKQEVSALSGGINWNDLPGDYIYTLLSHFATCVLQSDGPEKIEALRTMIRFGCASKTQYQYLEEFLLKHPDAPLLRAEMSALKKEEWKMNARSIENQLDKLRADFAETNQILSEWGVSFDSKNSSSVSHQISPPQGLDHCIGIQIGLKKFRWQPDMASRLSWLKGEVIKLDAKEIGRERFINEVLPMLKALPANCPIILDASNNELQSMDLAKLVDFMKVKQTIYRLDLSNNPVVRRGEASDQVAELFAEPGPLTHLYLKNTGFNDETAQIVSASLLGAVMRDAVSLQHLDFRSNPISADGVADIIRGTFDPMLNEGADWIESVPKVAYSLKLVRFDPIPEELKDVVTPALDEFKSSASLFNNYRDLYLYDGFGQPVEADAMQLYSIFELFFAFFDDSRKDSDGSMNYQMRKDSFQRTDNENRL